MQTHLETHSPAAGQPARSQAMRWLGQTLVAGALAAASSTLFAQPADGRGAPPMPPAQALEACKTLSSGQACSFTAPQGSVKGTCWAPEGKPLACKPKDAPNLPANAPQK